MFRPSLGHPQSVIGWWYNEGVKKKTSRWVLDFWRICVPLKSRNFNIGARGTMCKVLISGFHRASLQSVPFIVRLMHSIIQHLEVKIYVVQNFKRHKIKNYSDMFRILCDTSSGSTELCFPFVLQFSNYASKHRPSTPQNIQNTQMCQSITQQFISYTLNSIQTG